MSWLSAAGGKGERGRGRGRGEREGGGVGLDGEGHSGPQAGHAEDCGKNPEASRGRRLWGTEFSAKKAPERLPPGQGCEVMGTEGSGRRQSSAG